MKKILLTLSIFAILITTASASHLMGGYIHLQHVSGMDYIAKVVLFRDVNGIAAPSTVTLEYESPGVAPSADVTLSRTANSGTQLPGVPYGVEIYTYKAPVTLNYLAPYQLTVISCCRNAAIQNISNPGSQDMLLRTIFDTRIAGNSSPDFKAYPVTYLPVNSPWQFNPLPADINGDSLVCRLDTPWEAYHSNVGGYTAPPANPGGDLTVNPQTGMISWNASATGNYAIAMVVDEYRNGVKIGEVRLDLQFIVIPSGNIMAQIAFQDEPDRVNGVIPYTLHDGENLQLNLQAQDPDFNGTLMLQAFGSPFEMRHNPAQFTVLNGQQPGTLDATLIWETDRFHAREQPYLIGIRVSDGTFAYDETLMIKVEKSYVNNVQGAGVLPPGIEKLPLKRQ